MSSGRPQDLKLLSQMHFLLSLFLTKKIASGLAVRDLEVLSTWSSGYRTLGRMIKITFVPVVQIDFLLKSGFGGGEAH